MVSLYVTRETSFGDKKKSLVKVTTEDDGQSLLDNKTSVSH